ncbi:hypothetical protein KM043_005787 [Ampulex compressa]|nr:hypothetical protein KM043_005787 [Ampulex compressa]
MVRRRYYEPLPRGQLLARWQSCVARRTTLGVSSSVQVIYRSGARKSPVEWHGKLSWIDFLKSKRKGPGGGVLAPCRAISPPRGPLGEGANRHPFLGKLSSSKGASIVPHCEHRGRVRRWIFGDKANSGWKTCPRSESTKKRHSSHATAFSLLLPFPTRNELAAGAILKRPTMTHPGVSFD